MEFTFYFPDTASECEIPLYLESIKAGFPSPADDYIEKRLDLNKFLIKNPPATFFVKVEGNSMEMANIYKGDILIIDKSLTPKNNDIIIANINGEFTVKRLKIKDNDIYLMAESHSFKNTFSEIKIDPTWDFDIFGVVTYIIHKAR